MTGRPFVPAGCRSALRELLHGPVGATLGGDATSVAAARQHVAACSFCASRLRAAESLGRELSRRPVPPADLGKPLLLERIHESAAESAEAGPMGQLLSRAPVPMPTATEQPQLDTVVGESTRRLASELVGRPEQPAAGVWSAVRSSILDEVAAQRATARRVPIRWSIVAASLAASVAIATVAVQLSEVSNGTSEPVPIVFTELDHPPDVEFAVLRFGGHR